VAKVEKFDGPFTSKNHAAGQVMEVARLVHL